MIGAKARRLSQRLRRVLVLAEYAGIFAYAVAWILAGSSWWWSPIIVLFVAAILIHHQLLVPFTQEVANKRDDDLDERQTAVRDKAHRTAYRIMGTLILGALFLIWLIIEPLGNRQWVPEILIENPLAIYLATFWFYITLPTAVIAWREPDTEPDE